MTRRVLALALTTLAACAQPAAAQETETIDVVGDASLSARNDTARVVVGVEVRRRTPRAALGAAAARMRRVLARVQALGVESRDIRTRFVVVDRVAVGKREPRRIAYEARNSVSVTIREVSRVGRVIDAAAAAGATGIGGPSFFVSDTRALYRRALVAAFEVARAKAQDLATEAGVTLGPAVSVREEGFESGIEDQGLAGAPGEGVDVRRRARTPIRPGRTRVTAGVFVRFAIQRQG